MRLQERFYNSLIKKAMNYAKNQMLMYREGPIWVQDKYLAEVWCNRYYKLKGILIKNND